MNFSLFGPSGFQIPVTAILLFSLLALIIAGWLVFTLIIRYHWKNYGTGGVEILTMNFVYFVGSLVLGGFMTVSAIAYSLSTPL